MHEKIIISNMPQMCYSVLVFQCTNELFTDSQENSYRRKAIKQSVTIRAQCFRRQMTEMRTNSH